MNGQAKILEFNDVTLPEWSRGAGGVPGVTFDVRAADLVVVLAAEFGGGTALFDLAEGLKVPDGGTVAFMGEDWAGMPPFKQSAMRGRIGRSYERQGWISNLSVYDNVALSQRHHTGRSEDDIRREAGNLAAAAGLASLPDSLPDSVPDGILRKAEWVRAFIGKPALALLERPDTGGAEDLRRLGGMIAAARDAGTAVLWVTPDRRTWEENRRAGAKPLEFKEGRMTPAAEE